MEDPAHNRQGWVWVWFDDGHRNAFAVADPRLPFSDIELVYEKSRDSGQVETALPAEEISKLLSKELQLYLGFDERLRKLESKYKPIVYSPPNLVDRPLTLAEHVQRGNGVNLPAVTLKTTARAEPENNPKPLRLVGLSGYSGVGKDAVAEILIRERGYTRVSFAAPLRMAALGVDPYILPAGQRLSRIIQEIGWDEAKRRYPEVRRFLQRLGTEGGREIHGHDCWIKIAREKINQIPGPIVITDVRFPNEADMIRKLGGDVWRVNRPGVGPVNSHISDSFQFSVDFTLENDGDMEHLRHEVLRLF
jgi:hypothetical protein